MSEIKLLHRNVSLTSCSCYRLVVNVNSWTRDWHILNPQINRGCAPARRLFSLGSQERSEPKKMLAEGKILEIGKDPANQEVYGDKF